MPTTEITHESLDKDISRKIYETMLIARKFEEQVDMLFAQDLIHGTTHLAIGEEATAVGTVLATETHDYVLATHRGHQHVLAKGLDLNAAMAEMLGKSTGVCKGKGGSMHMADIDKHILGTNGVLGSNAPIACGAALSIRQRGEDRIVVCFFGDGSSNLGAIHESMNLAAAWNLPVLFVLVNNGYGISTSIAKASRDPDLAKRAIPFAIPAQNVDGNDVVEVYHAVKQARSYVAKNGPMLIVEHTYRISGHSKSDVNRYRTAEEIDAWRKKCPILRFRQYLLENGILAKKDLADIECRVEARIQAAVEYAKNAPSPPLDAILEDVYA